MTEKRFWLVPIDYFGEQRFVKDKKLIGEKSMSNQEVVDLLNNQDDKIGELQERNDRQRERLDELYQLILNRDYDGQEELIKELEEYEQLLQYEMKFYCE